MKRCIIWILVLIFMMSLLAGCGKQGTPKTVTTETTLLTADELAYFNGDAFFNGDCLNIRNQFLSSLYDEPSAIDLFQLFYCGSGRAETITDEELLAVLEKSGMAGGLEAIVCPCEKISSANMDAVLNEYMGLTLAATKAVGLGKFVQLPEYNAYYFFHGDTNYRSSINFLGGERTADVIRLSYNDGFLGDGKKVLTLQQKNGSYLFVANQRVEAETAPLQLNDSMAAQARLPQENEFEVAASEQISAWRELTACDFSTRIN